MTERALVRHLPAFVSAAAVLAFALLAGVSARAELPAPASGTGAGEPTFYYFTYAKRWPSDGGEAADCADASSDSLPPGRYRAQIVRFAPPGSGNGPQDIVALRFGLHIGANGELLRIADITNESQREAVQKNPKYDASKEPLPPVSAGGANSNVFKADFAEILAPLMTLAESSEKVSDPLKLMRLLCGSEKPERLSSNKSVKFTSINNLLRYGRRMERDDIPRLWAFYSPTVGDNTRAQDLPALLAETDNHEGFVLAGYVGPSIFSYHRDLHAAFRNDLKLAARSFQQVNTAAGGLPRATTPPPAPPGGPAESSWAETLGQMAKVVFALLMAFLGIGVCRWFSRELSRQKQQLQDLREEMKRREQAEASRHYDALKKKVDHQAYELDSVREQWIKADERLDSFDARIQNLESRVAHARSMDGDDDPSDWRDEVDERLRNLGNAVRKLDEAVSHKAKASNDAEMAGQPVPALSGGPVLAGTRRRGVATEPVASPAGGPSVPAPAVTAGVPARTVDERLDALTELEQTTGIPLDRALLAMELGTTRTRDAIFRWLVERYLPERRDPAFYGSVGEWFSRISQGHAELLVPALGDVYEKELHDIGGYGPPQYGSLDQIVGLVRPGLRIDGRTNVKPRVVIPS
ncbi:MAG TPA: hypothetical protein VD995_31020 [Azospirillum sp.]|nr:hypothetical protein [Azospirillum sp.]